MYNTDVIESIRILPNDKINFETEEDFRNFIGKELVDREGYYYFVNSMMRCPDDTLVLFQYDGKIRACGILIESEKVEITKNGTDYSGYYRFDIDTVYMLEEAIDKDKMKEIYPDFKTFNQSKQIIPLEYVEEIVGLLMNSI